jgi:hypothetical protein
MTSEFDLMVNALLRAFWIPAACILGGAAGPAKGHFPRKMRTATAADTCPKTYESEYARWSENLRKLTRSEDEIGEWEGANWVMRAPCRAENSEADPPIF